MSDRLLTGLRIWDGLDDAARERPEAIWIRDGRIEAIGEIDSVPAHVEVVDFGGQAVAVPGLIDSHVHLTLDPQVRTPDAQAALPVEDVIAGTEARALGMLRAGITSARDLGGGDGHELALRDRIERGELVGPRLLCAGQPLTSVGGHCHFWGGEVASPSEIEAHVERQVASGVDWIKVMATGGLYTPGTQASAAQFSASELQLVREVAARHARPVASHCHGTAGIRNSAAARLRTVEHCSFAGASGFGSDLPPELCPELAAAGLWVSPTINSGWGRFLKDDAPSRFRDAMARVFEALLSAGVPLIASTDAGIPNVHHTDLPRALPQMQAFTGLSRVEVLRSATRVAAEALQLESETGSLRAGLSADLLILDADPTQDLARLQTPRAVYMRGSPVSL